MKIGIAGPISTESIRALLSENSHELPRGIAGAPFLATLIAGLISAGHQVSAFTLAQELAPGQKSPVVGTGDKFKIYYGPYRKRSIRFNSTSPGRIVDLFRLERRAIKQAIVLDKPDVIHAHWSYEYALAALASGVPALVTCHDSPLRVLRYMPNLYRFGRLLMALRVFRRATCLTAVSPYLRSEIGRFAKADISVIPNPAPFSNHVTLDPDLKMEKFANPLVVMINNGWDKRKNVEAALKAFPLFCESFPGATLQLFGQGYQVEGPAENWAKQNHLDRNVVFHGVSSHEEIMRTLEDASLLLHTSREETFGLVLIEAMTAGVPVIGGADSGGVPWVVDYGKAGVLVDVESPKDIANGMKQLLQSKERYSKMRRHAFEYVQNNFSADRVIEKYIDCYKELLSH